MTNRTTTKAARFQLGSSGGTVNPLVFNGWAFPIALQNQNVQRIQSGSEVTRVGRGTVVPFRVDDLSQGFVGPRDKPVSQIFDWEREKNLQYINEGIWGTWMPMGGCLPPVTTLQTAVLNGEDLSGFRAANKRVHALMFGQRFGVFFGTNGYRDVSTSNPAIERFDSGNVQPATACAVMKWNSTLRAVVAYGNSSDIFGYTNLTSAAGVVVVTLGASDYVDLLAYFPDLGYNLVGGTVTTNGYWYAKDTDAVPASLSPVVTLDTKDLAPTTWTALNTGVKNPAQAFTSAGATNHGTTAPTNPTNVLASDNAYCAFANATLVATGVGYWVMATNFGLDTSVPSNALIDGVLVEVERKETDAAVNAFDDGLTLVWGLNSTDAVTVNAGASGTRSGENKSSATEWGTADAYVSYGGATDNWSTDLTAAIVRRKDFGVAIAWIQANVAAQHSEIDHIRITVYYHLPGTQFALPNGGWSFGTLPNRPHRVSHIAPESTDTTAYTINRQLWLNDISFDSSGGRLLVNPNKVYLNVAHVEDAFPYQGGVVVFGGPSPGPATVCKLVADDLTSKDLGFPSFHGLNAVRGIYGFAVGVSFLALTAYNASTDAQWWRFFNGRWYAAGALLSKAIGGAMSTLPLAWAERTMGLQQNIIYAVYPNSTSTAVARQYEPPDAFMDPQLSLSGQTKQDGPLYVQLVELNCMPEEANKAVMAIQCQSRFVDANVSYGTVTVDVDTGGDRTIAVSDITRIFPTNTATFTDYNIVSSGDPGVSYRTLIIRITLNHETATTETPNALPLLFSLSGKWSELFSFGVVLSDNQPMQPMELLNGLRTLTNNKVAQRFQGEGLDIPVTVDGADFRFDAGYEGLTQPRWADLKTKVLKFSQAAGATS